MLNTILRNSERKDFSEYIFTPLQQLKWFTPTLHYLYPRLAFFKVVFQLEKIIEI